MQLDETDRGKWIPLQQYKQMRKKKSPVRLFYFFIIIFFQGVIIVECPVQVWHEYLLQVPVLSFEGRMYTLVRLGPV